MIGHWQQRIAIVHYNIWRFERWTRRLVFNDEPFLSIGPNDDSVLDDSYPGHRRHAPPNYSAKHFSILIFLVLVTVFNCLCALLLPARSSFRFYGLWIIVAPLSLWIGHIMGPSDSGKYLKAFKKFESMPAEWKRRSGLTTFLMVVGIWAVFIASFVITA